MTARPLQSVTPVVESEFGLDGGAMFGIVPKPLWHRKAPSDEANRIRMTARCLLLCSGEKIILVDTGLGSKWTDKESGIYAIQRPGGDLEVALARQGLRSEDVTDVVMTHLHFDHAGGLTRSGPDGPVPSFPNANVHVQRENWAWAHHPTLRDAGSYRRENFAPLVRHVPDRLHLLDGPGSVLDGLLEVEPMAGHTPGMQIVRFVAPDGRTFVFLADLIPTRAHVPLAWVMGYDLDPARSVREKREVLERAIDENWILVLQHEPELPFVRVERAGVDRYRIGAAAATADAPELH
ncbi:MAG: MBL fold metallo-hydrolase [Deltaproteobacteria bacterium]|nr:MAG: MBL fold metallo-hydrolase [Deltaproteobacteria bacterium]